MSVFGVLVVAVVVPAVAVARTERTARTAPTASTVFVASGVVFSPSCETFLRRGFAVVGYQIIRCRVQAGSEC